MCDVRRPVAARDRPRWSRLYTILLLTGVALALVELAAQALPLQAALRCGLVGVTFGAMAWWVRVNRAALDQLQSCACASRRLTIRIIASRPGPPEVVEAAAAAGADSWGSADETREVPATASG